MKKIYKITGCTTDVHEDSYKDGEGAFCNNWSIRETNAPLELKEYPPLKERLAEAGENYLSFRTSRRPKRSRSIGSISKTRT
jgi:hypothetical protein